MVAAGTGGAAAGAASGGSGGSAAGGAPIAGGGQGTAGSSGSSGTGGAVTGGAGGSAPGGSGGSGGSGGGSSGSALVTDDFEGVAAGSPPNPALFSVRGNGTVQISTDVPRAGGGAKVVKVVSAGGATMFVNKSVFPLPSGVVHFRVWMRFTNANWEQHVGFVASGPGMESQEVRFGGQKGAYHANLAGDGDGLSPDPFAYPSCALCVPPVADQWVCLRGMLDFPGSRAQLYVGEKLAVDAEKDSVKESWHSGTGVLPTAPTELGFGWAVYGGVENTVYYDDLAIGYEPIACN
jgi:hypothetical protein